MTRSFSAAFDVVKKLDAQSMIENRPISRAMVTNVLIDDCNIEC